MLEEEQVTKGWSNSFEVKSSVTSVGHIRGKRKGENARISNFCDNGGGGPIWEAQNCLHICKTINSVKSTASVSTIYLIAALVKRECHGDQQQEPDREQASELKEELCPKGHNRGTYQHIH